MLKSIAVIMCLTVGACAPSENPLLTKLMSKCMAKVHGISANYNPVAVAAALDGGTPETYCRNLIQPIWDRMMLTAEHTFD